VAVARKTTGSVTSEVDCDAGVAVGHLVYFDSLGVAQAIDVFDGSRMPARAAVVAKSASNRATVQFSGLCPPGSLGLLIPGASYLAGTPGLSPTPPSGPARRYVQHVAVAVTAQQALLDFQNPIIAAQGSP
jgi:hypothetical protein